MPVRAEVQEHRLKKLWDAIQEGRESYIENGKDIKKNLIRPMTEMGGFTTHVHYISKEARRLIPAKFNGSEVHRGDFHAYHNKKRNGFVHEHIVPVKALYNCFLNSPPRNMDVLRCIFEEYGVRALITLNEDGLLKPKSEMPPGWRLGDDPLARYRGTGIELIPFEGQIRFSR